MSVAAAAERSAAMRALGDGGVARDVFVTRSPDNGLLTVGADVGLRLLGGADPGPFDLAGATGPTLAQTLPRAAGEAVERYAVANMGGIAAPAINSSAIGWDELPHALREGYPAAPSRPQHPVYDLRSGAVYALPTELIDFPTSPDAGWPGNPSGAAAHLSREAARQAALLEVLERDSVMRAWFGRVELAELEFPDGLPLPTRASPAANRLRVLRTPTAVNGLNCFLGACLSPRSCGFGAAVDHDDRRGAARALREALQIASLLELLEALLERCDAEADPRLAPEVRRARFWGSSGGVAAFGALGETAEHVRAAPAHDAPLPSADELVGALPASVLPLEADLTYRLPGALQESGWRACKIVVLGLQPLVMDDNATWAINQSRIPQRRDDLPPHPLI